MPEDNDVQTQSSEEGATEGEGTQAEGEGQDEQVQTLEQRLADVGTQLKKKDAESRSHQRRADRNEGMLQRIREAEPVQKSVPPSRRPASQGRVQPTDEEEDPLIEFANETAKEAALLRELISRGLTLEDGENLEFDSVGELRLHLDSIQQQREIDSLREQIERGEAASAEGASETSDVQIDTGGRTGGEDTERIQQTQALRDQAADLKNQGRYTEAQWVAIRAAQTDPGKIIVIQPGDSQE